VRRALWALLVAAMALLAVSVTHDATAQQDLRYRFRIDKPGGKDLPLALPLPTGDNALSRELWDVVKRDLEISGWFRILDSRAFIEPEGAGLRPGSFEWSDWDVPGAVVLAKTRLAQEGNVLRSEVWVYDVPGRGKLAAKAFSGPEGQVRKLGHRIADQIILAVTGQPGIFSTRLAAVSKRTGNKEVYLMDLDGEGVIPITRNKSINLQPSWSPQGDALLFTSYRAGNPDLYLADLKSAKTRRLSSRPGINTGASWSPLGNLIALTLSVGGDTDIYTIEPYTGKEVARLTRSAGIDVSPSWAPDGSQVAFVSERSGSPQIYRMSAAGGGAERVTFQGSHNTDPSWSPDGERIAYVGRDGRFDVFTVQTDGKKVIRLTQGQGDNEDPSWSPDGRYIAFASNRSGGEHIYVATADGRHQIQVSQGRGAWTNPAWSPILGW